MISYLLKSGVLVEPDQQRRLREPEALCTSRDIKTGHGKHCSDNESLPVLWETA